MRTLPVIDIVLPCYNPPEGWSDMVIEGFKKLEDAMQELAQLHLIIVNDGSAHGVDQRHIDRIGSKIKNFDYLVHQTNKGKGAALRTGVSASLAPLVMVTDIDFPYTHLSMIDVMTALLAKGGIISGLREETYYDKVPFFRRVLSKSLRLMLKYLMRLPVTDSQCGLKAMDSLGKRIFLETTIDRYLFDLEFLQKAKGRVHIHPVKVELRQGVIFTTVGMRVLRTEFRNFLRLLLKRHSI